MAKTYFVAGTDTGVGKTTVACLMLRAFAAQGYSTMALKPIAAGSDATDSGLRNDDAVALQAAATLDLPYELVNPFALSAACSPHIAASLEGRRLTMDRVIGFCRGTLMQKVDFCLIEGAGGWRVPINDREFLSQLPVALQLPVILVVGVRLGCLNHAVLTAEAIIRDGLKLAGWVANCVDGEMAHIEQNIDTLKRLLPAPCLGVVPNGKISPDENSDAVAWDFSSLYL